MRLEQRDGGIGGGGVGKWSVGACVQGTRRLGLVLSGMGDTMGFDQEIVEIRLGFTGPLWLLCETQTARSWVGVRRQ